MESLMQNLADELLGMSETDQAMRNRAQLTNEWDSAVDEQNTVRLKEIVATGGWPTISGVGKKAASAAWLLVQHADQDTDFQAYCLGLIKQLPASEVSQANVAYLEDRVRVNKGKPQLYGTQFYGDGSAFGPRPIEDETNLDKRRQAVGLNSFAEYKNEIEKINKQHGTSVATNK